MNNYSRLIAAAGGEPAELSVLSDVLGNSLTAFLGLGGILLFVILIVSGFQFMTAGGDPKTISAAWKTLTFAIVGLIIVVSAFLILNVVVGFTGATDLLNFSVYFNN